MSSKRLFNIKKISLEELLQVRDDFDIIPFSNGLKHTNIQSAALTMSDVQERISKFISKYPNEKDEIKTLIKRLYNFLNENDEYGGFFYQLKTYRDQVVFIGDVFEISCQTIGEFFGG